MLSKEGWSVLVRFIKFCSKVDLYNKTVVDGTVREHSFKVKDGLCVFEGSIICLKIEGCSIRVHVVIACRKFAYLLCWLAGDDFISWLLLVKTKQLNRQTISSNDAVK